MSPEVFSIIQPVIGAGPVAALLLFAVWWLTRGNDKLVNSLNNERKERLDGLTTQIEKLEKKSEDCERDRLNLHRLLAEVRNVTHS